MPTLKSINYEIDHICYTNNELLNEYVTGNEENLRRALRNAYLEN